MTNPIIPSEQERKILLKYANNDRTEISSISDIQDIITKPEISLPSNAASTSNEDNQFNFDREAEENNALKDPNWKPKFQYDIQDPILQKGFQVLIRERYSLNAIKRIVNSQNLSIPRPDNLIDREYEIDRDYNFILKILSSRKSHKLASSLSLFAKDLCNACYNIFQIDELTINKDIIKLFEEPYPNQIKEQRQKQISPYSSLIKVIENNQTPNNTKNSIYDIDIFFKQPKSPDDIITICDKSNNPAFDNLIISFYIQLTLEHQPEVNKINLPKYMFKKANDYHQKALDLYLERYGYRYYQGYQDNQDYYTCLDRDITSIIQHQYNRSQNYSSKICDSVEQGTPMDFIKSTGDNVGKFNEINSKCLSGAIINQCYQPSQFDVCDDYASIKLNHLNNTILFPATNNCSVCVAAYELRRKGWNVIARPNAQLLSPNINKYTLYLNHDPDIQELSKHSNIIWINHATESAPDIVPLTNIEQIRNVCFEGERYHLMSYVGEEYLITEEWGDHIVTFEKINGNVYVYDPQQNKQGTIEDYFENKPIKDLYYYRVDNCYPIITYASKVVLPNNIDKSSLESFNIKSASGVGTYKTPSIDTKLEDDIRDYINQLHQEAANDPEYRKHLNDELKQVEETLKKFDKNDADYDDWLKHMKSPCK